MANFSISKNLANLPDIQRNYQFELWIPNIADLNLDAFRVRCRSAVIPQRGNENIPVHFMGMVQFYPGKPTFTNTFTANIEEFEDKVVAKSLYTWQQLIFDIETNGASLATKKSEVVRDIMLKMYKYNGNDLSTITFFNAWPELVGDVNLEYTGNDSVKYPVTFRFDRWELTSPRSQL
jgi:hypothetical protein